MTRPPSYINQEAALLGLQSVIPLFADDPEHDLCEFPDIVPDYICCWNEVMGEFQLRDMCVRGIFIGKK